MANLTKSTKNIIIAAAVTVVLGAGAAVLVLTGQPDNADGQSSDAASTVSTETYTLTDRQGTDILQLDITNDSGSYTFTRDSKVVSSTDSDGNVTSEDKIFWTSEGLNGLTSNETMISTFMKSLAGLTSKELVETDAADLEKYGLENPVATARLTFDGGEQVTLNFGIKNPAQTNFVYCRMGESRDVYLVSNYSVGNVYYPINDYVSMSLTPGYNASSAQELDYFRIERKDLAEPYQIAFMYDVQQEAENEDSVITTFNSHRLTSPFVAEIDSTKGKTYCYGLYGLTASECVSVTTDEEILAKTGLDDPFLTLTFKYGGTRYVLHFGDEIITTTPTEDENTPDLTTVTGYYGMLEGVNAVFAFDTSAVPWYKMTLQDIISRRPVSPYIYTCDSVVITTPDREYVFEINGDAKENSFILDGEELNGDKFRQLYQHLITAVGDEVFLEEGEYEPYISVTFNYREEYHKLYNTESDTIRYYKSDDRKNIVSVNGKVLFKVRQVYTERLIENIDALINGGELRLDW